MDNARMVLPHGTDNRTVNVYTHGLIAVPMNPFEMHEPVKLHKLPLALVGLIYLKYGNYIYMNIFFIGVLFRKYTSPQPIIHNFACNHHVRTLALGIHTLF